MHSSWLRNAPRRWSTPSPGEGAAREFALDCPPLVIVNHPHITPTFLPAPKVLVGSWMMGERSPESPPPSLIFPFSRHLAPWVHPRLPSDGKVSRLQWRRSRRSAERHPHQARTASLSRGDNRRHPKVVDLARGVLEVLEANGTTTSLWDRRLRLPRSTAGAYGWVGLIQSITDQLFS